MRRAPDPDPRHVAGLPSDMGEDSKGLGLREPKFENVGWNFQDLLLAEDVGCKPWDLGLRAFDLRFWVLGVGLVRF